MNTSVAIKQYHQAYRKLYQRDPRELRDLGSGWVLVNGARMQVTELERLTVQMLSEHRQITAEKRNIVQRLVAWFQNN
ncbi:MAG: hypothetical protein JW910_00715 [Anaerolineae bacterium]|nr:hypothetical protein [Anaerolineae bacterium]